LQFPAWGNFKSNPVVPLNIPAPPAPLEFTRVPPAPLSPTFFQNLKKVSFE